MTSRTSKISAETENSCRTPFIFINACQGAHITTMFYETVAEAFLALDAIGIIGPQIDIPVKFAAEYAKRFLSRLVGGWE